MSTAESGFDINSRRKQVSAVEARQLVPEASCDVSCLTGIVCKFNCLADCGYGSLLSRSACSPTRPSLHLMDGGHTLVKLATG